jgi:hypothetical protein
MNKQDIINLHNSIKERSTFASAVLSIPVTLRKGGSRAIEVLNEDGTITKQTVPECPLNGHDVRKVYKTQLHLNSQYKNRVEGVGSSVTGLEADVTPQAMRGKEHSTDYPKLLALGNGKTNEGREYLIYYTDHVGTGDNKPKDLEYFVDGRPATDDEIKVINLYKGIVKKEPSSTQKKAGITEVEDMINIQTVTLSNIKELKVGDYHFSEGVGA